MDEDSKGQRKMEDSGGGLLPAVEGHSLEQNRIEYTVETCFFFFFFFWFALRRALSISME